MRKYSVFVVLMLASGALTMPASLPDTAESVQNESSLNRVLRESVPEDQKIDVLVEVLRFPRSLPSVRNYSSVEALPQESKASTPNDPAKEDSVLAEDILDGKKTVVMVEFLRTPDNANGKTADRKQRSSDDIASSEKQESTAASGVSGGSETSHKEVEGSSSKKPQGQKESTEAKRQSRSDEDDDEDDMSVAETIVFRPLFSYRQDSASRRRSFRDVSRINPVYDYY